MYKLGPIHPTHLPSHPSSPSPANCDDDYHSEDYEDDIDVKLRDRDDMNLDADYSHSIGPHRHTETADQACEDLIKVVVNTWNTLSD